MLMWHLARCEDRQGEKTSMEGRGLGSKCGQKDLALCPPREAGCLGDHSSLSDSLLCVPRVRAAAGPSRLRAGVTE